MKMKEELIAPCGINCGACWFYLAKDRDLYKSKKSGCTGCISSNVGCKLRKGCELIRTKAVRFCFECDDFPCVTWEKLEKRYAGKYHTSLLDNLTRIKENGIEQFLLDEEQKWTCTECGGTISIHTQNCIDCGKEQPG